jgi:hypothetical protein
MTFFATDTDSSCGKAGCWGEETMVCCQCDNHGNFCRLRCVTSEDMDTSTELRATWDFYNYFISDVGFTPPSSVRRRSLQKSHCDKKVQPFPLLQLLPRALKYIAAEPNFAFLSTSAM